MDLSTKFRGVSGPAGRWTTDDANAIIQEIESAIQSLGGTPTEGDNGQLGGMLSTLKNTVDTAVSNINGLLNGTVQSADSAKLGGYSYTEVLNAAEAQTASAYSLSKLKSEIQAMVEAAGLTYDVHDLDQLADVYSGLKSYVDTAVGNIDLSNVDAVTLQGKDAATIESEAANAAINTLTTDATVKVKAALVADNALDADKLAGKTLQQIKDEIESGVSTETSGTFYVDFDNGDNANDGSQSAPFADFNAIIPIINNYDNITIDCVGTASFTKIQLGITNNCTIILRGQSGENPTPPTIDADAGLGSVLYVAEQGHLTLDCPDGAPQLTGTYTDIPLIDMNEDGILKLRLNGGSINYTLVRANDLATGKILLDIPFDIDTANGGLFLELYGAIRLLVTTRGETLTKDGGTQVLYDDLPDIISNLQTSGTSGIYYNLLTNYTNDANAGGK